MIPAEALEKEIAFLGATGSGKTSAAKSGIVEPALEVSERVVVIDPTGAWWGLRVAKNGRDKGYQIYLFGGDHGDYPLRARDAEVLAEAFGTSSDSAVFDTSLMNVAERTAFFTDFAEALRRKNRGPLKLIIDEAHLFMPQAGAKAGGAVPAMLHAGNNLVSLGRSRGLRITLISQRPAKLHKDSLTQVQSMVAMRLMAPQDRSAINDWISDQADPSTGKEIIASLPTLKPGEAWVWAPQANYLERVKFPMPRTFDSSRAPDQGDGRGPTLPPINLDALKGRLSSLEAETKANDPKELRAEIARLKKEAAKPTVTTIDPAALVRAEERGYERGKRDGYAAGRHDGASAAVADLRGLADRMAERAGAAPVPAPAATQPTLARPVSAPQAPRAPRPAPQSGNAIEKPLQRILDAVRWWNVMGIAAPSHPQVAFIAGYSHKSGTWATYLSRLRSSGLLEGRGDLILTAEGDALANEPNEPPSGDALRETVLGKIDAPLVRILRPIIEAYPRALSHAAAADRAGYSHSSGTWATYLSRLRTLDLIDGRGELRASDWLFPAERMAAE
jgi:hypothetical protein